MIEQAKEQIGNSFLGYPIKEQAKERTGEEEDGQEKDGQKKKSVPFSAMVDMLKQKTGREEVSRSQMTPALSEILGEQSTLRGKGFFQKLLGRTEDVCAGEPEKLEEVKAGDVCEEEAEREVDAGEEEVEGEVEAGEEEVEGEVDAGEEEGKVDAGEEEVEGEVEVGEEEVEGEVEAGEEEVEDLRFQMVSEKSGEAVVFRPLACERSRQNDDSEGEREMGERRMGKGGAARKEEAEGEEKKERGRFLSLSLPWLPRGSD